jgi:hypothetical protein
MKITMLSVCLLAFLFTFSTQTFAVDFTVNLTTDQHDANLADGVCDIGAGTGQCSLRAAVEQANNLTSDDRVLFNLPANSTITLTIGNGGEIVIADNGTLGIVGTGANNLTINGGTGTNRIFSTELSITGAVTISGLTLTGGNGTGARPDSNGYGGAIYGNSLTLDGVHVTGNSVTQRGGGINFSGGTNRVTNSTFSANSAGDCAGFNFNGGTITIINSSITGNTATNFGGGFCGYGGGTLRNITITNNTANMGGGFYYFPFRSALNFGNTIVAGNNATSGNAPEIYFYGGAVISGGGNLVGDSAGDSANTGFSIYYQPTDILDTNPQLDILRYNGGPTPTHALLPGSPAIDKGLNALAVDPSSGNALVFDQRGVNFPRIRDGNGDGTAIVDIGAFEFLLRPTAAAVSVSGRVLSSGRRGVSGAVVHLTKQNGEIQTTRTNSFGYYTFKDIAVGETYIINVYSKRYQFNPQVVSLTEDLSGLNFTAQ